MVGTLTISSSLYSSFTLNSTHRSSLNSSPLSSIPVSNSFRSEPSRNDARVDMNLSREYGGYTVAVRRSGGSLGYVGATTLEYSITSPFEFHPALHILTSFFLSASSSAILEYPLSSHNRNPSVPLSGSSSTHWRIYLYICQRGPRTVHGAWLHWLFDAVLECVLGILILRRVRLLMFGSCSLLLGEMMGACTECLGPLTARKEGAMNGLFISSLLSIYVVAAGFSDNFNLGSPALLIGQGVKRDY
ncbi:uncharacterized protein BDR25DRAFT_357151 [Lindgomyces ingoldianus]|uniref:Uncharacterized protein n=1 Tax=Lindgomyces ingoldianus TaxID=673940 RepID=A0ACB6QQD7_9PLEO|nr:uncharacterized protein BDR25DRAFT_357151 [Lindgomyces ingoldianus]KAF2468788.1 hypothetical protein BDR25DRAFT_357151 [Lindgomyces ingoldianus]